MSLIATGLIIVNRRNEKSCITFFIGVDEGNDMGGPGGVETHQLMELARMKIGYLVNAGRRLIDLPEPVYRPVSQKGFPRGKLGEMLKIVYEIKVNGLEYLFDPLR